MIKDMCEKLTAKIMHNDERLNAFLLRWGSKQRCPLSSLLFNIVLEILANTTRQKMKNKKVIQIKKENIKFYSRDPAYRIHMQIKACSTKKGVQKILPIGYKINIKNQFYFSIPAMKIQNFFAQ